MPYPTYNGSQAEQGWSGTSFLRGGGNVPFGTTYSTTQTAYTQVDASLTWEGVIPFGFSLNVNAGGTCSIAGGTNILIAVGLVDLGATAGGGYNQPYDEQRLIVPSSSVQVGFNLNYLWPGDDLAHVITLAFRTSNGSDAAQILNDSAAHTPTMLVQLIQTNLGSGQYNSPKAPWL